MTVISEPIGGLQHVVNEAHADPALAMAAPFTRRFLLAPLLLLFLLFLMSSVADERDDAHAREIYLEEVDPRDREGTGEVGEEDGGLEVVERVEEI